MRWLPLIAFSPLVMVGGCISLHEGNAAASREEITAHFRRQLHADALELTAEGRDQFAGSGRNQTGPFTIRVKREHDRINFEGVYTGSVQGGFNGTWIWSREFHAFPGYRQHTSSQEDTFNTF